MRFKQEGEGNLFAAKAAKKVSVSISTILLQRTHCDHRHPNHCALAIQCGLTGTKELIMLWKVLERASETPMYTGTRTACRPDDIMPEACRHVRPQWRMPQYLYTSTTSQVRETN